MNGKALLFFFHPEVHHVHRFTQGFFKTKGGKGKFEFIRFDFGHIQDVVDYPQKVVGRVFDLGKAVVFFFDVPRSLGDGGHPDDGVHGGPHFVAHVGQEFAFGPGTGQGFFPGMDKAADHFVPLHGGGHEEASRMEDGDFVGGKFPLVAAVVKSHKAPKKVLQKNRHQQHGYNALARRKGLLFFRKILGKALETLALEQFVVPAGNFAAGKFQADSPAVFQG